MPHIHSRLPLLLLLVGELGLVLLWGRRRRIWVAGWPLGPPGLGPLRHLAFYVADLSDAPSAGGKAQCFFRVGGPVGGALFVPGRCSCLCL